MENEMETREYIGVIYTGPKCNRTSKQKLPPGSNQHGRCRGPKLQHEGG